MKRALLLAIILGTVISLTAERPAHRPQTIAETFLRAMQVRDFVTARTCIAPAQSDQFDLLTTWSDIAGWFALASVPSDFKVLRSTRSTNAMTLIYDLESRGTVQLKMLKLGRAWYLDLLATHFLPANQIADRSSIRPANSNRTPQDRAKLFLDALLQADFAHAAEVGSPRTAAILKLMASLAPYGQKKTPEGQNLEILSENIEGSAAVVEYTVSNGAKHSPNLIKVGPDWMVDLAPDQLDF